MATPVFASPDEPAHAIHAIGVAHGQWVGQTFRPGHGPPNPLPAAIPKASSAGLAVRVPSVYQHWARIGCLAFKPDVPAGCLRLDTATGDRPALSYTARYLPVYSLAVGSVSLVTPGGARQIYLMRLISVVLSAALIASAVVTILEAIPSPLALTGLAVALTPMTLFLAGSINPNGLEVAAAIGLWVHGAAIATGRLPIVGDRLITRLGVASIALALSRPTSLLWLAIIGVLLLSCADRETLVNVARRPRARRFGAGLAAATLAALGWSVWVGAFHASQTFVGSPTRATASAFTRTGLGEGYQLLRQMIGVFGWLDTPAPAVTLLVWLFSLGAVVGVAVLVAPRLLRTVAATAVLVIIVPIAVQATYVHSIGYQWQGRYSLPLAAGIPILAGIGAGLGRGRIPRERQLAVVIVTGLAAAQFLAFAQALRRYTVGADGTIWFPWSAQWHPPIPTLLLLLGFVGLIGAASFLLLRVDRRGRHDTIEPSAATPSAGSSTRG